MSRTDGDAELLSVQQRLYSWATCFFGCGPSNGKGPQLRSYDREGAVVASFHPWPEHDNGVGYLNGGIISTVLDCHSAAAVFLTADDAGWQPLPGTTLPFLTAGLDVRFLRPAPLHEPVELHAAVLEAAEPQITVEARLVADGKTCASAVATWKRWRPRATQPPPPPRP